MKLSTKIDRIKLKGKILEALVPLTHQIVSDYDGEKMCEAYDAFYKKLDEILNLKWEEN